jgi:hypothetical protein
LNSNCNIFLNVKFLLFLILMDNFVSTNKVVWFLVWGLAKNQRNMQKKKVFQARKRLGRRGHMEGFQTSVCLGGYLRWLYPAHDGWATYVVVIVRCKESDLGDSWFHYYIHWRIHSIHFACKIDSKILFYQIIFKNYCVV